MTCRRLLALALATCAFACGETARRPSSSSAPDPRLVLPGRPVEPLERIEASGRPPLEIAAAAVEGYPPLPTYHASVRNVTDRPVRRVVATIVYFDVSGRVVSGESQDVQLGSPRKAIEPGMTIETTFLSRVERAPGVRVVIRSVTFLETGPGAEPVTREWTNPRYDAELAALNDVPPPAPR